jgi:DNA/RNA endonuclease YhcR with UshA esterase domain
MRKKAFWSVILLALIFSVSRLVFIFSQEKVISWEKAGDYVGQTVTVEGVIVRAHNSGRACFLNFHPDYQKYLSLVIFASDFNRFPSQPEKYYLNKKVRVKGRVLIYRGRPEIILSSPEQIKLVSGTGRVGSPSDQMKGQAGQEEEETVKKPTLPATSKTAGSKEVSPENSSQKISGDDRFARAVKEISWEEATDYLGQTVWVRGKVVATHNSGKACFLNFHRNWRRYFTVVIFASNFHLFPKRPEDLFLNREIRVYGQIREYQGKPEIIVESPEQIEIIR